MTFKIQTRWRTTRNAYDIVERYVIIKRDADDFGYADRDVTLKQLRNSLEFALQRRQRELVK